MGQGLGALSGNCPWGSTVPVCILGGVFYFLDLCVFISFLPFLGIY